MAALAAIALLTSLVPRSAGLGAVVRPTPAMRAGVLDLGYGCAGPAVPRSRPDPMPTLPPRPTARPRATPESTRLDPVAPTPASTIDGEVPPSPGDGPVEATLPPSPAVEQSEAPDPTVTMPPESGSTPEPTPVVTPVPEPTPTDTPEPTPTATPEPEPTPRPTPRPTTRPDPTEPPAAERTPEPDDGPPSSDGPGEAQAVAGLAAVILAEPTSSPRASLLPPGSPQPVAAILTPLGRIQALVRQLMGLYLWMVAQAMPETPEPEDPARATEPPPQAGSPNTPPPRYGSIGDAVGGIDVSHWNGVVPFGLVRDSGVRFVLMKASQGTTFVDPAYGRHFGAAREAGLLVGPYHFYDYRVDGRAQADHFVDTVVAAGGMRGSLPLVVDIECFAPFGAADQDYVRSELRAFVGRIYERTGRLPMVYTSWYMWRAVTGADPAFGDLPLWVACWRCARPALPTGWDDWDFWQVGSVVLPWSGQRLGSDLFDGDIDELRRLTQARRATR